jgi:uncharacterized protein involved in exopolysaccharide biosynthesis
MTIVDFVRLILKHIILLLGIPILLGCLVIALTMNPAYEYSSETILYTGLATGSSIDMDKQFSTSATNAAFDNLINIIKSRDTQEEVAVRLFALHLMLPEANPKYISKELYDELKAKIPKKLYEYVATGNNEPSQKDSLLIKNQLPPEINIYNYEKTVQNLLNLMRSSTDNYMYEVFNFDENKHYSRKAVSDIKAQRINSSDLIKLSYTVNDPGICQQTLAIYSSVCIVNYKSIKENRSDAVVRYFESELKNAKLNLKEAENKLLEFNKSSNIINYYEQSKAVAVVKEDMQVNYKRIKAELAGLQAGKRKFEEKLKVQEIIQEKNNVILDKKQLLGNLNFKIALVQAEIESSNKELDLKTITDLKNESIQLTNAIKKDVDELYSYQNSIDGIPISQVLPGWMNNEVEAEKMKAQINVIEGQNNDFQEVYAEYAPAGANMKRLEREIAVAEQGYLSILHGLSLAKLKLQDGELSSDLKTVDPPFFPLKPNPTKRAILIVAAAFMGGILTLGLIFVMEYFDDSLRNSIKGTKETGFESLGMIPKILLDPRGLNLPFIQNRLIEIITQKVIHYFGINNLSQKPKTIIVFSTQKLEGKTVVAGNLAKTLKQEGKKVLYLNYAQKQKPIKPKKINPIIHKILGYPDPRIDVDNEFLGHVSTYLEPSEYGEYKINSKFYDVENYTDILAQNNLTKRENLDFVILELPAIIYHNYPSELITNADLNILVCRSNRTWSNADKAAIHTLKEACGAKIKIIINGVKMNEIEALLGDLPKKRKKIRRKLKSMFQFQFLAKNEL